MKPLVKLFVLALVFTLPFQAFGLWEDAAGDENGWKESPWFGWFTSQGYEAGWLYHQQHGWMWCSGQAGDSVWMWSDGEGWWWSSQQFYPLIYDMRDGWCFYQEESKDPRWFYSYERRVWERDTDDIAGGLRTYLPLRGKNPIWWVYRLSGSGVVDYEEDGLRMEMRFDQIRTEVTHDPAYITYRLTGTCSGSDPNIGSFTGDVSLILGGEIAFERHAAFMTSTDMEMSVSIHTSEGTVRVEMDVLGDHDPIEELAARPNLDVLPIGYRVDADQHMALDMSMRVYFRGFLESEESFQESEWVYATTTIVDRRETMTINGREYRDVIALRTTTSGIAPSTAWYAKGVGLIKETNFELMEGDQVDIELVDTNLF